MDGKIPRRKIPDAGGCIMVRKTGGNSRGTSGRTGTPNGGDV